ncbi:DoxX family protein [Actinopolymorpha pittospori]|uniref:Membrane protein YphA (DoxX/SURF4 family) n=1 Tax=Actinopolymorpha pittospori TaxID=648752 RepID=A0A927N3X3_9ACTN|nr:DoxX family protein [Actinopolymorpha pittospori]MBE1611664.1 putative membrane protein YphA (DoxX/SURF4 family) [Actinopolymorpha pittospori]
MTLVRMLARPMLSAIFVIQGARAIRNPDAFVPSAKPLTDRFVPSVKRLAPAAVADRVPEDPRTLVRLNGAVHLLGGLALATGVGRRAGAVALAASLVPTTLAGHPFWDEDDPAQRANQQIHFLKNICMMGGLLLAAVDTEGKPGLMWRASHGAKEARQAGRRMSRSARREARLARKSAEREAKLAAMLARHEARLAAKGSSPARFARAARRDARRAAKAARPVIAKGAKAAKPVMERAGLSH